MSDTADKAARSLTGPANVSTNHAGESFADARSMAHQLKRQQQVLNHSPQTTRLQKLQTMANDAGAVAQRFKLKDHDEYGGYLAGDDTVRNKDNVAAFVKMLRAGQPIPDRDPITYQTETMVPAGESKPGSYTRVDPAQETPDAQQKNVIVDGHHRFIAYVEAEQDLPAIAKVADGYPDVDEAYHWSQMGDIDYEPPAPTAGSGAAASSAGQKGRAKKQQ
jgi:hypothetical protein